MVGGDHRLESQRAAHPTPGLSALDQEREASMADEGGTSAAVMERELPASLDTSTHGVTRHVLRALVIGAAVGLVIGAVRFSRRG